MHKGPNHEDNGQGNHDAEASKPIFVKRARFDRG